MIVRSLTEQSAALIGSAPPSGLNHQPTGHVIGADCQPPAGMRWHRRLSLIEDRLIADTAQAAAFARMRLRAVGTCEMPSSSVVDAASPRAGVVGGEFFPGFSADIFDQLARTMYKMLS